MTISEASDKSFTEFYGCRARWINNGVPKKEITKDRNDIDKYRFSINTKVFLHPGRICKAKNQIVLCKAFSKLISEGYDIVLLLAGNNEDKHIYNEFRFHSGSYGTVNAGLSHEGIRWSRKHGFADYSDTSCFTVCTGAFMCAGMAHGPDLCSP